MQEKERKGLFDCVLASASLQDQPHKARPSAIYYVDRRAAEGLRRAPDHTRRRSERHSLEVPEKLRRRLFDDM